MWRSAVILRDLQASPGGWQLLVFSCVHCRGDAELFLAPSLHSLPLVLGKMQVPSQGNVLIYTLRRTYGQGRGIVSTCSNNNPLPLLYAARSGRPLHAEECSLRLFGSRKPTKESLGMRVPAQRQEFSKTKLLGRIQLTFQIGVSCFAMHFKEFHFSESGRKVHVYRMGVCGGEIDTSLLLPAPCLPHLYF
uniref:Uncharacterized protein n=1 Tax=Sphaerodactylus townsendi TaxID=933632 RepID=A0ACB8EU83_9SAUR